MPHLDDIPEELVESIVRLLDFDTICNIRLASSSLSLKSSNGHFRTFFYRKAVVLTDLTQLREFGDMTQAHRPGHFVRHIRLIGDSTRLKEYRRTPQSASIEALTRGLSHLRLNSKHHCLEALTLDVKSRADNGDFILTRDKSDWLRTWNMATCVFRDAMQALRKSELKIDTLDVYGGIERCSLAGDELHFLVDPELHLSLEHKPPVFLHSLKSLSLSLSQGTSDLVIKNRPSPGRPAAAAAFADDFQQLLVSCPNLKVFRLHWFNLLLAKTPESCFLTCLEDAPHFAALEACTLRGIHCDATSLLRFLQNAPLRRLTLENIHFSSGEFRSLFDHLSTLSSLEYLFLDNLREKNVLYFPGPGQPHVPLSGRSGPNSLIRTGEEAREPIAYNLSSGRTLGSSRALSYFKEQKVLYGPP